jgi:hypothetical protein
MDLNYLFVEVFEIMSIYLNLECFYFVIDFKDDSFGIYFIYNFKLEISSFYPLYYPKN